MKTSEQWGWMQTHSDRAYGPFDSREEAVADADAHDYSPNDGIVFGRCVWADPESVLPSMDEFVEKLDESAYDNDFSFWEDEVFDVRDPENVRKYFDAEKSPFPTGGDWFDKVRAQGAAFIGDDGKSMPIPMMGAYSERCAGGGAAFLRWLSVEGPETDLYPLDVTVQGPMATKAEGHLIGAREVDGELVLTVRMERAVCDQEAAKARRSRVIHEIILNDKGGDYCQTGGADPYWIAWPLSGRVRLYTEAVSVPKTCYTAHQLATEMFPNMKLLMKKEMECSTRAAYVWVHKRFIEGALVVELYPLSELDDRAE
jgi:hypothetical protein